MKSEELLYAMNGIDDLTVIRAKNYSALKKASPFPKIIALAACISLIAALSGTAIIKSIHSEKQISSGNTGQESGIIDMISDEFTITAYAAEGNDVVLEKGNVTPLCDISDYYLLSFVMDSNEDDPDINYSIELPSLKCSGDNIKSITYTANNAYLEQNRYYYENSTETMETVPLDKYEVAYDSQDMDDDTVLELCGSVPKTDELVHDMFDADSFDDMVNGTNILLNDVSITCTVTYNDGTTASQTINIGAKFMSNDELGIDHSDYYADPAWLSEGYVVITFELE